jgi:hypothetical protein
VKPPVPIASSLGGRPGENIRGNNTQGSDAVARAKAIMRGEAPAINVTSSTPALDAQVEAELIKARPPTFKRRTNFTTPPAQDPNAPTQPAEAQAVPETTAEVTAPPPGAPSVDVQQPTPEIPRGSSSEEQAKTEPEDTRPLSPQFAALARQRRALQVRERELQAREKAISEAPPKGAEDLKARLKSEPLSVLQEAGVTYDQLTEAILANQNAPLDVNKLKEELRATLKKEFEETLSSRDTQQEKEVFTAMRREADQLAASDSYELVRETSSVPVVMELIRREWKQNGVVLDVSEAMALVEEDLESEALKVATLKKMRAKLQPQQAPAAPAPKPAAPAAPQPMRTLTNRDTTTAPLSRRDRALQAFYGGKR